MTRPRKNPGASGIRTRDLPLSLGGRLTTRPTRRSCVGYNVLWCPHTTPVHISFKPCVRYNGVLTHLLSTLSLCSVSGTTVSSHNSCPHYLYAVCQVQRCPHTTPVHISFKQCVRYNGDLTQLLSTLALSSVSGTTVSSHNSCPLCISPRKRRLGRFCVRQTNFFAHISRNTGFLFPLKLPSPKGLFVLCPHCKRPQPPPPLPSIPNSTSVGLVGHRSFQILEGGSWIIRPSYLHRCTDHHGPVWMAADSGVTSHQSPVTSVDGG